MGKELSLEEKVKRSKLVIREFPKVDIQRMNRVDREKLVGIVYGDKGINGAPISEIQYKQLVAISYSVYNSALKDAFMSDEEIVMRNELKELENSSPGYRREELIERLGIKLENSFCTEIGTKYESILCKINPVKDEGSDLPFSDFYF